MNKVLVKSFKNLKPLLWIDNELLVSRGYELWKISANFQEIKFVARIPATIHMAVITRVRIFERILRGGIQTAQRLDKFRVLVVTRSKIWKVDLQDGSITLDFVIPDGRRLLFMTRLSSEKTALVSIVFGEYFSNPERMPVRIWRRDEDLVGRWETVYTFPAGSINHVHNVCLGRDNNLWILTGDFLHSAAIWSSSLDLRNLRLEMGGEQRYRCTWIQEAENGDLLWATDSQLELNYLQRASFGQHGWKVNVVSRIEGSSIYWQPTKYGVVFSSTVEPGQPEKQSVMDWFCCTRGSGIVSDDAVLYIYDYRHGLLEVARSQKDFWPMRLGQFGCFLLPSGELPGDTLAFGAQGLKKYDGMTHMFKV